MNIYLGSGKDHKDGFKNLDKHPFEGVDYICDVTKGLPFGENTIDYIYSQDFLEHLPTESKIFVMNEIWRVLKNGGVMEHLVPNAGSRNDFGSPTHLSHWNLQQFEHFDVDSYRWRVDREYEGFIGGFKKIIAQEVNPLTEDNQRVVNQSIHVAYRAIK